MYEYCAPEIRNAAILDFHDAANPNLLARWDRTGQWFEARLEAGIDPYQKFTTGGIAPETVGAYRNGKVFRGVNLASQEYLSLSRHPKIRLAARDAIERYGVHSAGSAALMGNTALSVELERRMARFLGYEDCTVFPIGWAAGYGVVKTLVRPKDHVIIDVLAHACLQEAANDATPNVHRFPHLSVEAIERRLRRIRIEDKDAGILVVTETLFSMDSDVPDVRAIRALCRDFGATLLVDCAHDLGAMGPTGRGMLEHQDLVGQPDILMGSFSKTFASVGGFVACNSKGLKFALRSNCGPSTFTNAMTPIQAAVVTAALDVVDSEEGAERRRLLMANILHLREGLRREGFRVMGQPSAIVPVILGDTAISRIMTRHAIETGGIVNLVEHPAVARNMCRWRLQVMADHTPEQIDRFLGIAVAAWADATAHVEWLDRMDEEACSIAQTA